MPYGATQRRFFGLIARHSFVAFEQPGISLPAELALLGEGFAPFRTQLMLANSRVYLG